MPTHNSVKAANDVIQVDAYWMRHYAADFLKAANDFVPPTNRFSPVRSYLIGHSIELSLKAFLFTVGFKRVDRRRLNHDLDAALAAAEHHGLANYLDINADDRDQLKRVNRLYSKKEFEYFESLETIWDPPDYDPDAIAFFAQRLYEAIEGPVWLSAQSVPSASP